MYVPQSLYDALQAQLSGAPRGELKKDAQELSLRYRGEYGGDARRLQREAQAKAYAAARMPATFGAVFFALRQALACFSIRPATLLDAGAGTGAAAWAADALLDLDSVLCLEREEAMRSLGSLVMRSGSPALANARWVSHDLCLDPMPERAGLVTASYVLNEVDAALRPAVIGRLWEAAEEMLLLVEPGTPAGFALLSAARAQLLARGAHIAAPCPHENACPMAPGDWCHFACRVPRTQIHRDVKGGEAPYEDEKFFYMAFAREPCHPAGGRILRHPLVHTGHVAAVVCGRDGIRREILTEKDGPRYKLLRKAHCGDPI